MFQEIVVSKGICQGACLNAAASAHIAQNDAVLVDLELIAAGGHAICIGDDGLLNGCAILAK